MKRSRSALVVAILTMALVLSPWVPVQNAAQAATGIKVIVNGTPLNLETEPVIIDGRTMVPLRAIFEALNARVVWSPTTSTVTGYKGTTKIQLKINDTRATVNEEIVYLEVPATIVSDRTLVPARFIAESLGAAVDWNNNTRTVTVTTGKADATPVAPPPEQPPEEKNVNGYNSGEVLRADETFEYAAGKTAVFKAGTIIDFYDNGYVKSGTLSGDNEVKFDESTATWFRGAVDFSEKGLLSSGTLAKDTDLPFSRSGISGLLPYHRSQGVSAMFKGGSKVDFQNGLVVSGTLAKDYLIEIEEGINVDFRGGTVIEFNEQGFVSAGFLSQHAQLKVIDGDLTKNDTHVYFKGLYPISFQKEGFVRSGTLLSDTLLDYRDDESALFKEGTMITFNEKGFVRSGTLAKNAKIESTTKTDISFSSDTEVVFNDEGYVVSGVLGSDLSAQGTLFCGNLPIVFGDTGYIKSGTLRWDSELQYAPGKRARFKGDTLVTFNSKGFVISGIIKDYEDLPFTSRSYNTKVALAGDCLVEFTDDGFVRSGMLKKDAILPYAANKVTAFKAGTQITFSNGYVKTGTLKNDTTIERSEGASERVVANSVVTFSDTGYMINVTNP